MEWTGATFLLLAFACCNVFAAEYINTVMRIASRFLVPRATWEEANVSVLESQWSRRKWTNVWQWRLALESLAKKTFSAPLPCCLAARVSAANVPVSRDNIICSVDAGKPKSYSRAVRQTKNVVESISQTPRIAQIIDWRFMLAKFGLLRTGLVLSGKRNFKGAQLCLHYWRKHSRCLDLRISNHDSQYDPEVKMLTSLKQNAIPEPSYAVYGDLCSDDSNCSTPNAMCTLSGYCTCMPGFYVNFYMPEFQNYTCLPELGAPCVESEDCSHILNSTCNHGMCTCLNGCGASASRKLCLVQQPEYNRACKENSECLLFGARGYCKSGTQCICEANSRRLVYDEDICWTNVAPNGACQDERDCISCTSSSNCDDSPIICDNGTCQCFPGYHANGPSCNKDAPNLDNYCTNSLDCEVENSECKSSYCKCKTGYYQDGKLCTTGVGGTCASVDDCQNLENTNCSNARKCECLPEYVASTDIKRCLPIGTAYGSPCEQNQQCTLTNLGINAACQDGTCLGEGCNDKNDCYLSGGMEGLVCRNYKCVCDYGYEADDLNTQCISGALSLHHTSALLILLWSAVLFLIM
ncbi:hypothetical protein B566_EDAN009668 [Ephemera danica]|nr:hypothetical protein B566_EDAN009668 [Ephemera danica]